MPIKSGREKFDKEEIIEILKRNVALYKDEKEFVDYIVNLAMYLMDRHYAQDQAAGDEAAPEAGAVGLSADEQTPAGGVPLDPPTAVPAAMAPPLFHQPAPRRPGLQPPPSGLLSPPSGLSQFGDLDPPTTIPRAPVARPAVVPPAAAPATVPPAATAPSPGPAAAAPSPVPNRAGRDFMGSPMPPPAPPVMRGNPAAGSVAAGGDIDPMEQFLQSAPPRPFDSPRTPPAPAKPQRPSIPESAYDIPMLNSLRPDPPAVAKPGDKAGDRAAKGPAPGARGGDMFEVKARPLVTPSPETRAREAAKPPAAPGSVPGRRAPGQPAPGQPPGPGAQPAGPDQQRPPDGEDKRNFDVIDHGRTRVYRVVRPFRSSTQIEVPCPVCGAMVPAESRRCTSCGHLM